MILIVISSLSCVFPTFVNNACTARSNITRRWIDYWCEALRKKQQRVFFGLYCSDKYIDLIKLLEQANVRVYRNAYVGETGRWLFRVG